MALSLSSRCAICISAIILITSFEELHLKKSFFTYGVENLQCPEKIRKEGIKLINTGIEMMYTDIIIDDNYYKAVQTFYNKMKQDENAIKTITKYLKRTISDTDAMIERGTKELKERNIEVNTQALLIYLYTIKDKHKKNIYSTLNKMLRDHAVDCNVKTICDDELSIAPYAAALTATLLHWDELKSDTDTMTYRGLDITICEVNNPIVWVSFTSTSSDKKIAEKYGKVTFYSITKGTEIDKKWLPKDIAIFSAKPEEEESLFHPGSVFKFTSIDHKETTISYQITLQDPTSSSEYCPGNDSDCK